MAGAGATEIRHQHAALLAAPSRDVNLYIGISAPNVKHGKQNYEMIVAIEARREKWLSDHQRGPDLGRENRIGADEMIRVRRRDVVTGSEAAQGVLREESGIGRHLVGGREAVVRLALIDMFLVAVLRGRLEMRRSRASVRGIGIGSVISEALTESETIEAAIETAIETVFEIATETEIETAIAIQTVGRAQGTTTGLRRLISIVTYRVLALEQTTLIDPEGVNEAAVAIEIEIARTGAESGIAIGTEVMREIEETEVGIGNVVKIKKRRRRSRRRWRVVGVRVLLKRQSEDAWWNLAITQMR